MSRLARVFQRCTEEGRAALVGYITAYDPDADASLRRLSAACAGGVDILEVGVPFSDPAADGPEVQAAMVRALDAGSSLPGVLDIIRTLRAQHDTPIVLFSYCNPLLSQAAGVDATMQAIAAAGVDALLVVDLPPESADLLRGPAASAGLSWIGLVAPTSSPARRARVLAHTTGFVYAVSLTGVTGTSLDTEDAALERYLRDLSAQSSVPVCVGFGVRDQAQVRALANLADGVVVGSELIRAARRGDVAFVETLSSLAAGLSRSAGGPP